MRQIKWCLLGCVLCLAQVHADNWPTWRGPLNTGVSEERNLPTTWSPEKNIRWKVALPEPCNSTPIIWENHIFITQGLDGGKRRALIAFDRRNGKRLWQQEVACSVKETTNSHNPPCSASPVTDGKTVYAQFGSAGVVAYDFTGKQLWHRDLGPVIHKWGNGSSPVLYKNLLIVYQGPGEPTFLTALNKTTGDIVWKKQETAINSNIFGSWGTPLVVRVGERDELIMPLPGDKIGAEGEFKGFDPATGDELWRCRGLAGKAGNEIYASPVISEKGDFIVGISGHKGVTMAVRPGGRGDVTESHRVWQSKDGMPQRIGTGLIHKDYLYLADADGLAECLEVRTGKEVWKERLGGNLWGSMVLADGKIYVTNLEGQTFVLAAGPEFKLLAKNDLQEKVYAAIAVSQGELFIRTYNHLYCIGAADDLKPPPMRVLLLGDSTVIGSVCRKVEPKADHLEMVVQKLLAAEKDLPPVEVINQGRDGEYIQGLLADRYEKEIAKLPGFEFIVIRYGLNDIYKLKDFDKVFPASYKELIARLRKDFPKAEIILETTIPYFTEEKDKQINDQVRAVAKEEKLPLLDSNARYAAELKHGYNMLNYRRTTFANVPEKYRALLPADAATSGAVIVMDNHLDAHLRDLPGWFGDRHPNLAGYHVIGSEMAKILAPKIRARTKKAVGGLAPEKTDLQALVPDSEVLARHKDQEAQINRYLDRLVQGSDKIRAAAWQRDFASPEAYEKSIAPWRSRMAKWLGGMDYQPAEFKARQEKLAETKAFTAFRVWFNAFEDVEVYGILLLPNGDDNKPRPAVICIHGMQGSPESVCGLAEKEDYHQRFGGRLVEAGFVVFAPLDINTLKGRSFLDKKARMVGQRLQGLEQYKMRRVVDYLQEHPRVDPKRIGIFGISWGGRTSMNAAAMDPRLAACVISGHFMESTPKMVTPSPHYTAYIEVPEDYAFFERHFLEFSDADICTLICPRPLFIEQGRQDRVAYWDMAQKAFGRVQECYGKLQAGDKAVFHIFEGGHMVHGDEAIRFLTKHLQPAK